MLPPAASLMALMPPSSPFASMSALPEENPVSSMRTFMSLVGLITAFMADSSMVIACEIDCPVVSVSAAPAPSNS